MKPMLWEPTQMQMFRDHWWANLPTNAKKNIVRRAERSEARAKPQAVSNGYVCPKCFKRYPTAQLRLACRRGHEGIIDDG